MQKKGAQSSEFKLIVFFIVATIILLVLSQLGVVSLNQLVADAPVAVGIAVSVYTLARAHVKAAELKAGARGKESRAPEV